MSVMRVRMTSCGLMNIFSQVAKHEQLQYAPAKQQSGHSRVTLVIIAAHGDIGDRKSTSCGLHGLPLPSHLIWQGESRRAP
jgi:hypothetical protein